MSKVLSLIGAAHGQCRLSVVSTTSLKLAPYGGQNLGINGQLEQIPSAGVTISNGGLSSSTLYYVYAYMNSGTMTLELSATGHSTSTDGAEIKTGDATRTLVGMIYTNSSSQFVSSLTSPTCLNWFNRRLVCGATGTVSGSTSSTASFAEITSNGRVPFLAWPDEAVEISVVGSASNSSAGNITHSTSPGLDGAEYGAQTQVTTFTSSVAMPTLAHALSTVSEGMHTAGAFGKVSTGTGTWNFGVQVKTYG